MKEEERFKIKSLFVFNSKLHNKNDDKKREKLCSQQLKLCSVYNGIVVCDEV